MLTGLRLPATLAALASALGLWFATTSTLDYAAHLDRRVHDLHCSVIPGVAPSADSEACRTAMYSPYSAILKDALWGGVPISLFAQGAFAFFLAFAAYLLLAGERAPRRAWLFQGVLGATPALASLVMLGISVFRLGSLCRVCVGIYLSSALLLAASLWGFRLARRGSGGAAAPAAASPRAGVPVPAAPSPVAPTALGPAWLVVWLAALGGSALAPALVYARSAPDHRPYLGGCAPLKRAAAAKDQLVTLPTSAPRRKVTLFEDPLCPTCKAFHERLVVEGTFERLEPELALFPLDSECNWMLSEPLHPGACVLSRAVVCGKGRAREVLEWAYEHQEALAAAGKQGKRALLEAVEQRFGKDVAACADSREARATLNKHLQFATDNAIPVSTPQLYLGERRLCDEDTDIGLRFTLTQLAPEVLQ